LFDWEKNAGTKLGIQSNFSFRRHKLRFLAELFEEICAFRPEAREMNPLDPSTSLDGIIATDMSTSE
jgi:hypothetical protein